MHRKKVPVRDLIMTKNIIVLLLIGCLVPVISSYDWPTLRVKWGKETSKSSSLTNLFKKSDLEKREWVRPTDKGWTFESSFNVTVRCLRGDPIMCSVYDVNDHILGIQIGFPVNTVDAVGSPITFKSKPYVKKINRLGTDVYVMTIFFVDPVPDLFLNGRPEWSGNIGDGMWLLNWSGSKYYFTKIPTDLEEMRAEGFTKHKCVPGMGTHYFKELDSDTPCPDLYPIFIIYDYDKPVGFGVYTLGYQLFNKYSKWNENAFGYPNILKDAPLCLRLGTLYPGVLVTHFYFISDPTLLKCYD